MSRRRNIFKSGVGPGITALGVCPTHFFALTLLMRRVTKGR